jgi:hypothetical protein
MDYQKQRELYMKAAREHLENYEAEGYSQHIVDIVASVMMTRDDVLQGGGFVQAICDNDLRGALARADTECTKHLRVIAMAYPFAFIQQSK